MRLWRYGRAIECLGQRYRLEASLGSGGMADVCLAWDEQEKREVAVKVIKPDDLDQKALERFTQEAAQVAQWDHPHILHIYGDLKLEFVDLEARSIAPDPQAELPDTTQESVAVPYLVMEYAQGGDLQKRLNPGQPYPLSAILSLFPPLCSAVSYAHAHGIIHRDLKPLNVLFRMLPDETEQVVLGDFGQAVEVDAAHYTYARGGTLPYMAPEQLRGQAFPASDIFALGVIFYQLCTGRLPFRRALLDLHSHEPINPPLPPSLLQPLLPEALDEVVFTALSDDPEQRFSDATLFWECARSALLSPPGRLSHRRGTLPRSLQNQSDALHPRTEDDREKPGSGNGEGAEDDREVPPGSR